jgi:hypothetical protein
MSEERSYDMPSADEMRAMRPKGTPPPGPFTGPRRDIVQIACAISMENGYISLLFAARDQHSNGWWSDNPHAGWTRLPDLPQE